MRELVRLESATGVSVEVAPWRGGKIVSLRDASGREWLAPAPGGLLPGESGGAFTQAEMAGWDECAPTIDAGSLPDGTCLSDHGDLWDQAWEVRGDPVRGNVPGEVGGARAGAGGAIETVVHGLDWLYTFRRTIRLEGSSVHLDYRVVSRDTVARPFLWAVHPQFVAPPGSRVVVEGTTTMVRTDPGPPLDVTWDPSMVDLPEGWCGKWWSPQEAVVTEARLEHVDGAALTMRASGDAVRWLGVWSDAGVWAAGRVVALEPATGWFDDAAGAWEDGSVLVLEPGDEACWSIEVNLDR